MTERPNEEAAYRCPSTLNPLVEIVDRALLAGVCGLDEMKEHVVEAERHGFDQRVADVRRELEIFIASEVERALAVVAEGFAESAEALEEEKNQACFRCEILFDSAIIVRLGEECPSAAYLDKNGYIVGVEVSHWVSRFLRQNDLPRSLARTISHWGLLTDVPVREGKRLSQGIELPKNA